MLTMKYKMRLSGDETLEFARQIGSYSFKEFGDYVQFLAFDDTRADGTPDVWSGWKTTPKDDMVPVRIFVMNDAGSTVASFCFNDERPKDAAHSLDKAA